MSFSILIFKPILCFVCLVEGGLVSKFIYFSNAADAAAADVTQDDDSNAP
jgi:hypothetical protein